MRCSNRCRAAAVAGWQPLLFQPIFQCRHRCLQCLQCLQSLGFPGIGHHQRRGQGERKGAALARCTVHCQLAAQQVRQVARNRQPQPGAAVLAVRAAIRLAKGVKDQVLLVQRNADAGVFHGERHGSARMTLHTQRHFALGRELDRVREQVAQDLRQPQRVGVDAGRQVRVHLSGQRQAFFLCQRAHRLDHGLHRALQRHRFGHHRRLAGFNLGQVQDVVDQ